MNAAKTVRDTVIILVLVLAVYAGIQMFGSKNPGPVEQATTGMPADPHNQDQAAPPAHMTEQPELTDGEAIVVDVSGSPDEIVTEIINSLPSSLSHGSISKS